MASFCLFSHSNIYWVLPRTLCWIMSIHWWTTWSLPWGTHCSFHSVNNVWVLITYNTLWLVLVDRRHLVQDGSKNGGLDPEEDVIRGLLQEPSCEIGRTCAIAGMIGRESRGSLETSEWGRKTDYKLIDCMWELRKRSRKWVSRMTRMVMHEYWQRYEEENLVWGMVRIFISLFMTDAGLWFSYLVIISFLFLFPNLTG